MHGVLLLLSPTAPALHPPPLASLYLYNISHCREMFGQVWAIMPNQKKHHYISFDNY